MNDGRTVCKGGAVDWIHRHSGAAQLLAWLSPGRTHGPGFLTGRKAPDRTRACHAGPATGRQV
ncbi:hypothetical protein [Streptomyces sp. NBC_01614]|uniref:hypothetical protein n=1 Tax=Streptomyces sp. NBC_01614 TaxID=2975897 RepID=UPI00386CBD74